MIPEFSLGIYFFKKLYCQHSQSTIHTSSTDQNLPGSNGWRRNSTRSPCPDTGNTETIVCQHRMLAGAGNTLAEAEHGDMLGEAGNALAEAQAGWGHLVASLQQTKNSRASPAPS